MTLNFDLVIELDLVRAKINWRDKRLSQRPFNCYYLDTQTHTPDRLFNRPTKVVDTVTEFAIFISSTVASIFTLYCDTIGY